MKKNDFSKTNINNINILDINMIRFKDFCGERNFEAKIPIQELNATEFSKKYLNSNKLHNIFEWTEYPSKVKPFYDIDGDFESEKEFKKVVEEVREEVITKLSVKFPLGSIAISESHGWKMKTKSIKGVKTTKKVYALSFHFIINNYETTIEELRRFNEENNLYSWLPHCDKGVYRNGGNMRCLYSHKPCDQRQKIPYCWNNDPLKHLIQSNEETNQEFIKLEFKEPVFKKIKSPKKSPPITPPSSEKSEEDDLVIVEKPEEEKKYPEVKFSDLCKTLLDIDNKYISYDDILNVCLAFFNECEKMNELDDGFTFCKIWIMRGEKIWGQRSDYEPWIKENWKYWRNRTPTKDDGKLTMGSLKHWADEVNEKKLEDLENDPDFNKFEHWYNEGINIFMENMNKICMFYIPDSDIIYYEDELLIKNNETKARSYFANYNFFIKDDKGKDKKIKPFDVWNENIRRKKIKAIVMKPDNNIKNNELNLWKGLKYKNTGDYDIKKIQHILDHIKKVWANNDDELYVYIISWFSRILQEPHNKNQTCIALHSKEGVGKSIILELFGKIIGSDYYMECNDMDKIFGRFNASAINKLLIDFNETAWGGNKKMKGKFKSFITDSTIEIEKKGKDPLIIDSNANCVISTNEDWIADVKKDNRRFLFIECNNDILKLSDDEADEYFEPIYEFEDIQDLANYFYNYDISNYKPKKIKELNKKSDLYQSQIIQSADSLEQFLYLIIEKDIDLEDYTHDNGEIKISKEKFYELYMINNHGGYGNAYTQVHFWTKIRKLLTNSIKIVPAKKKGDKGKIFIESIEKMKVEFMG